MKSVAVFLIGFFPYALPLAVVSAIILYPASALVIMIVVPVIAYGFARVGTTYLLDHTGPGKLGRVSRKLKEAQFPARVINIFAYVGFALSGVAMILAIPFLAVNLLTRHLANEIKGQVAARMRLELHANRPEEAIAVMREVARWYREQAYRVWPDEQLTREALFTDEATPKNFYLGTIEEQPACAFILQWSDREYWPDSPEFEAGYLHKLCVCREFAHLGMTARVVEALKTECRRRGAKYLRLDTGYRESVVRDIYLNAGFRIVKTLEKDGKPVMLLYEMEL